MNPLKKWMSKPKSSDGLEVIVVQDKDGKRMKIVPFIDILRELKWKAKGLPAPTSWREANVLVKRFKGMFPIVSHDDYIRMTTKVGPELMVIENKRFLVVTDIMSHRFSAVTNVESSDAEPEAKGDQTVEDGYTRDIYTEHGLMKYRYVFRTDDIERGKWFTSESLRERG